MGLPLPMPPARRAPRSPWWRARCTWLRRVACSASMQSAQEMLAAVEIHAQQATVFIATAAVADWRPAVASEQKSRRMVRARRRCWASWRTPTSWPRWLSRSTPWRVTCFAWALQRKAMTCWPTPVPSARKGSSAVGGQYRPATFGQDDNALLLVDAQGHRELPRASKRVLAQQLVAEIADRRTAPKT